MEQRDKRVSAPFSKVPQVTIGFWIIKILATTVGETGGDAVSMTLKLGYASASLIFLVFFAFSLATQMATRRFHAVTYWVVVVATTTIGTTLSDYLDRTVGLGYVKSSIMLFFSALAILYTWKKTMGRIEFEKISSKTEELFYWLTILVSNTLGTALGDFTASSAGLGFENGALIFTALLSIVGIAHFLLKKAPPSLLFWCAYILSRPLGATLGDTLTKAHEEGGLGMERITSSLVILGCMVVCIFISWKGDKKMRPFKGRIH